MLFLHPPLGPAGALGACYCEAAHDLWGLQGHWEPVIVAGTLFLHPSVAQKGTETARQLERSNSSDVPSRRAKGWTSIGRAPATEADSGSEPRRSVRALAPGHESPQPQSQLQSSPSRMPSLKALVLT